MATLTNDIAKAEIHAITPNDKILLWGSNTWPANFIPVCAIRCFGSKLNGILFKSAQREAFAIGAFHCFTNIDKKTAIAIMGKCKVR